MITTNKIPQGQLNSEVSQTITNGVTDKAPSEDAVFDALALKSPYPVAEWYSDATSINPADGSTYYMNLINNSPPSTFSTIRPVSPKTNATFLVAVNCLIAGTLASSEGASIEFLNLTQLTSVFLTTDFKLTTNQSNSGYFTTTLATTIGDQVQIRVIFPTWATNPTTVQFQFFLKAY